MYSGIFINIKIIKKTEFLLTNVNTKNEANAKNLQPNHFTFKVVYSVFNIFSITQVLREGGGVASVILLFHLK